MYYLVFNMLCILDSEVLWNSTETVVCEGDYTGIAVGKIVKYCVF